MSEWTYDAFYFIETDTDNLTRSCPRCGRIIHFPSHGYKTPCYCGMIFYGWEAGKERIEEKLGWYLDSLQAVRASRQFADAEVVKYLINGALVYKVTGGMGYWHEYWLLPPRGERFRTVVVVMEEGKPVRANGADKVLILNQDEKTLTEAIVDGDLDEMNVDYLDTYTKAKVEKAIKNEAPPGNIQHDGED